MIRENPASRGTETSAEVLVGPPGRMVSNKKKEEDVPCRARVSGFSPARLRSEVADLQSKSVVPRATSPQPDGPR